MDASAKAPEAVENVTETLENDEKSMTFCCGGKKRCPRATQLDDGSVMLDDDDAGSRPVKLDPEQARMLRGWLEQRGY